MSEENVEIVRKHIEAYRQEDAPTSLSFLDPYVVWDPSRVGLVDANAAYGPEAVLQAVLRYVGAFEDYDYEVRGLTDLGSGGVLAVVREKGTGKGSGVHVERSFATLYTLIDAKIVRVTMFPTEAEALEAAGLGE
jgi:ketosteroid isomerase-like protein